MKKIMKKINLRKDIHNRKKLKNTFTKIKTKLQYVAIALMTTVTAAMPTTASAATVTINPNTNTNALIGSIVEFICQIAFYIGIVVLITGVFMLVMAYREDNSEQQTRGVRVAVVGAALVGFRVLLQTAGLIG